MIITGSIIGAISVDSVCCNSSPTAIWQVINQWQLMMLLTLLNIYISKQVIAMITGLKILMFSGSVIHTDSVSFISKALNVISFEQKNAHLIDLNVTDGKSCCV